MSSHRYNLRSRRTSTTGEGVTNTKPSQEFRNIPPIPVSPKLSPPSVSSGWNLGSPIPNSSDHSVSSGSYAPGSPNNRFRIDLSGSNVSRVPESPETLEDVFNRMSFKNAGQERKIKPVIPRGSETLADIFDTLSLSTEGSQEPRYQSSGGTGSSYSSGSSSIRPTLKERPKSPVKFGQPFENLFDQFDKDPSVGAMVQGQQFVNQHFQTHTYPRKMTPDEPQIRVSCDSSISSWSSSSSSNSSGSPDGRVALDSFSKAKPSPIKKEVWNTNWDKKFDHHWI